jgi:zinc transport system ATP-binding protein
MKEIAVSFNSVSFSYGDVQVLDNASFHIHWGEFAAMVGPNGSGKTTILKLLFGLEIPADGNIEIFGKDYSSGKCKKMNNLPRANMAYVPQQFPADNKFPITVHDIVRMGLLQPFSGYKKKDFIDKENTVTEAMEKTDILNLASRPYRSLSGGQKRRALVARALAARPDLLVLDEPTANMDIESETRLYETLGSCKGKTTILIVTHDTEFVTSLTDKVLCLGDGCKVVQHKVEAGASERHAGSSPRYGGEVRILHGENIPADDCCR